MLSEIYRLNIEYDYEYSTLMEFYYYEIDFELVLDGYGRYNEIELVSEIKSYCKLYLDTYESETNNELLLNLKGDRFYNSIQEEPLDKSKSEKTILKEKKWYQLWK